MQKALSVTYLKNEGKQKKNKDEENNGEQGRDSNGSNARYAISIGMLA